jgi:MinD superfamily P-loop ATPase
MSQIEAAKTAKTTEHDITRCGICSEAFKAGEVAVQAARWWDLVPPSCASCA